MVKNYGETARISYNSKTIYVYDEKLGWINVTIFLDNLKKAMNKLKNTKNYTRNDFNLIRLYYSSGGKQSLRGAMNRQL